jgi:hypothetical protein
VILVRQVVLLICKVPSAQRGKELQRALTSQVKVASCVNDQVKPIPAEARVNGWMC